MASDAAPLVLTPSAEVTNALMTWPAADKLALARALEDSVANGIASADAEREHNRALIHSRLAELTSGKAKLLDAEEVFAAIRARSEEVRGE
ncbi:MAG TPA: addiction module protein [Urbifossiella sp.]|jgi:putative addiction module component (TIGR02574 family)|nr:addiction module protein [Urbifossiella sp.]